MLEGLAAVKNALLSLSGINSRPEKTACPVKFKQGRQGTDAVVDCSACEGQSSLSDPLCRRSLVKSLSGKAWMDRLLLEKNTF
jgi:hypothetical protein